MIIDFKSLAVNRNDEKSLSTENLKVHNCKFSESELPQQQIPFERMNSQKESNSKMKPSMSLVGIKFAQFKGKLEKVNHIVRTKHIKKEN